MDLKNNRRGRISEMGSHDGVTYTPSQPEPSLNGLLGRQRGCRSAVCYAERNQRRRSGDAGQEQRHCCRRRRQHALHSRSRDGLPECWRALRARQGQQRRWRLRPPALRCPRTPSACRGPREEVDERLEKIMIGIHENAAAAAKEYGREGDYVFGANVAGFPQGGRRDDRSGRRVTFSYTPFGGSMRSEDLRGVPWSRPRHSSLS